MLYDVVIVGAGPAGLTAAIYAARANLKTLILEQGIYGGLMQKTLDIENYPGYTYITGPDLSQNMYDQAMAVGAEYKYGQVQNIVKTIDTVPEREWFRVHLSKEIIETKTVIIATGATPKKLGVPGEEEFAGRGVSYCAVCDGAFFKNKHVVVVGGGDSAIEEANYLTKFANRVTIVHRRDKFRAQPVLVDRVLNNPKINIIYNHELMQISGDNKVESVSLRDTRSDDGFLSMMGLADVQGVFIYVGNKPNTDNVPLILLNENGYIPTDELMATRIPGIFAAGDVRDKTLRQIATAVGDGTQAAISAQHYIENHVAVENTVAHL
jgi:thioredoxin reductase (NADPH)